jgi:ribosomal protein S18 acetylase RimI-like enzyme
VTHSIKKVAPIKATSALNVRLATLGDLDALAALEERCFDHDRLSKRRFRHWLQAPHGILWVAQVGSASGGEIAGYGLVWCHKGTRLARLYSLAVSPSFRGLGVAVSLFTALVDVASVQGRVF